jgi:hypothetical protein
MCLKIIWLQFCCQMLASPEEVQYLERTAIKPCHRNKIRKVHFYYFTPVSSHDLPIDYLPGDFPSKIKSFLSHPFIFKMNLIYIPDRKHYALTVDHSCRAV